MKALERRTFLKWGGTALLGLAHPGWARAAALLSITVHMDPT